MTPFKTLTGIACPLPIASIDTDQIIPARFMSRPRKEGYGGQLFFDLRRRHDGALRTDLTINDPTFAGAGILLARRNFGSGSSREAAVYAIVDAGFRVVIAPSFGDIFTANAVNNGLLPARVSEADGEALIALASGDAPARMTVDLESCSISACGRSFDFAIDPVHRTKLLNGWDDIALTMSLAPEIEAFAARDAVERPWAAPSSPER